MKPRGIHAAFSRSTFVCALFHTRTSFICVVFVSSLCSLAIALIQFFTSYPPHVFVKWLDKRHLPLYISICIFPLSLFPSLPLLTHEPTHTLSLSLSIYIHECFILPILPCITTMSGELICAHLAMPQT